MSGTTSPVQVSATSPETNVAHAVAGDPELPSYQDAQADMQAPASQSNAETTNNLTTSHKSALLDGQHEWLILRTTTKPRKPESLPVFEAGDAIKGEVELDPSKKGVNGVKSVTISIVGTAMRLNHDPLTFLEQTQVLWTPTLTPFSPTNQYRVGNGKLDVKHSWSFSFTLPERVGGEGSEYVTPPTLALRSSPVSIEYKLVVQLKRQGLFKPSNLLNTVFGYRLATRAEPPSALRQMSLRDGGTVLGPNDDPQGWKVLPPVSVKGYLGGNSQPSEVEVTLAISQPTTYPLGSPVPLFVVFKSTDTQALDLLATPRAIGLELLRTVSTASQKDNMGKAGTRKSYTDGEGFATWWAADVNGAPGAPTERRFQGELNVPPTLIPSFTFPRCNVQYTLALLPPLSAGWTSHPAIFSDAPPPILSESVSIVAKHAPGMPRAQSATPPGYKDESAAQFKVVGKTFLASGFI